MGLVADILRGKGKLVTAKPVWWQSISARRNIGRLKRHTASLMKSANNCSTSLKQNNKKSLVKNLDKFEKDLGNAAKELRTVLLVVARFENSIIQAEKVYAQIEVALKSKRGISEVFIKKHDAKFDAAVREIEKADREMSKLLAGMEREQELVRKAA